MKILTRFKFVGKNPVVFTKMCGKSQELFFRKKQEIVMKKQGIFDENSYPI